MPTTRTLRTMLLEFLYDFIKKKLTESDLHEFVHIAVERDNTTIVVAVKCWPVVSLGAFCGSKLNGSVLATELDRDSLRSGNVPNHPWPSRSLDDVDSSDFHHDGSTDISSLTVVLRNEDIPGGSQASQDEDTEIENENTNPSDYMGVECCNVEARSSGVSVKEDHDSPQALGDIKRLCDGARVSPSETSIDHGEMLKHEAISDSGVMGVLNRESTCDINQALIDFKNGDLATALSATTLVNKPRNSTKTRWRCDTCFLRFATRSGLRAHKDTHPPRERLTRSWPCNFCPKIFPSRAQMYLHQQTHGKSKRARIKDKCKWPCGDRQKVINRRDNAVTDRTSHATEEGRLARATWPCNLCAKIFVTRDAMRSHRKIHKAHVRRKWRCALCPKIFDSGHGMAAHKKTHTLKERGLARASWPCKSCEKVFVSRNELRTHRKTHTQNERRLARTTHSNKVQISTEGKLNADQPSSGSDATVCDKLKEITSHDQKSATAAPPGPGLGEMSDLVEVKHSNEVEEDWVVWNDSVSADADDNETASVDVVGVNKDLTAEINEDFASADNNDTAGSDDANNGKKLEPVWSVGDQHGAEDESLKENDLKAAPQRSSKQEAKLRINVGLAECNDRDIDVKQGSVDRQLRGNGGNDTRLRKYRSNTKPRPFKCPYCEYTAIYKRNIKRHIDKKHPDSASIEPLLVEEDSGDRGRQCDKCGLFCPTEEKWRNHNRTSHPLKLWKCPHCPYSHGRRYHLKMHLRTHTKDHHLKCPHCDYKTSVNSLLKDHIIARHTEAKTQKCPHCDFVAKLPRSIRLHVARVHKGSEINYRCNQCDYHTAIRFNYLSHMNVHKTVHAFKCPDEGCGKSFKSRKCLRTHVDNKNRKLICAECGAKFPTNTELKKHFITHTGVKDHVCRLCDAKFMHPQGLYHHFRAKHPDQLVFHCESCDVSFADKKSMNYHNTSLHHLEVVKKNKSNDGNVTYTD